LKLVISTDPIQAPMTGIGEYTLRLIEALLATDGVEALYGYNRWGARRLESAPPRPEAFVRQRPDGLARSTLRRARRLFGMLAQSRALQRMDGVVYHEPNYLPARFDGPTVVTVHDLSHLHYPECHPRLRVRMLSYLLPRVLERAGAVITVSEFVAREVRKTFSLPAERVHAVHNGVDPGFCPLPAAAIAPTLARHGLSADGYMLCLATLEPRKNLDRLLTAFAALPASLQARFPLVLAGAPGWRNEALRSRIERLAAGGKVRYLGYVPAEDRAALYAGARAFAYPARYEGFGLPPLEAMACATPVLTSNVSAMPEVVGEAALTVDPADTEAIRDGLHQLCEDASLRERLRAAGPARAARFTWANCAQRTAMVYQQVAA
jgi:alpha-1,3-rhamnosyl/mannosyltransferase